MDDRVVEYVMGVDIGQKREPTALCILEVLRGYRTIPEWGPMRDERLADNIQPYNIVYLERFRLGRSYPKLVETVGQRLESIPRVGKGWVNSPLAHVSLVVGITGVGRPVLELFEDAGFKPVAVTMTNGDAVTQDMDCWRVPKRDLVSTVSVLQQQQRLHVAEELPEAGTLVREMETFRYTIKPTASDDSYTAWREREYDDMVFAVALACYAVQADQSFRYGWGYAEWGPNPTAFYRG
jgi:hypothetical protein